LYLLCVAVSPLLQDVPVEELLATVLKATIARTKIDVYILSHTSISSL
jgi:hypothetical protein